MTGTSVLTSPGRLVWPAAGVTKRDVFEYYEAVASALVRHLADRPVTLARFPEGVDRYGWYQTQCRGPAWIPRRRVGTQEYCVIGDVPALLWAVNAGTIEFHPLLSRDERVDQATAVVFDLDPGPPAGAGECSAVALALRARLAELGVASFVKTSGSLGLHVHVPLGVPAAFAETKAFARRLARELAGERPELVVDRAERSARAGRVLVDWAQNAPARSLVAPYSLRAMERPTVATPLAWSEVETGEPLAFGPADALERLRRHGDLFEAAHAVEQTLPR